MTELSAGRIPARAGLGAALALGVALIGVLGAARTPAMPDGQVVAVPTVSVRAEQSGPRVEVLECDVLEGGLRVRGRVDQALSSGPGGPAVVAVTGPAERTAGRAVGAGWARDAGFGDTVGSFVLDLPWGRLDSTFGVVLPDSAPTGAPRTGPVTQCPTR